MSGFTSWNSGYCRYFSNASCHASALSGGTAPASGRHSTMDKPEPLRRTAPPSATSANTSRQQSKSQAASGFSASARAGRGNFIRASA